MQWFDLWLIGSYLWREPVHFPISWSQAANSCTVDPPKICQIFVFSWSGRFLMESLNLHEGAVPRCWYPGPELSHGRWNPAPSLLVGEFKRPKWQLRTRNPSDLIEMFEWCGSYWYMTFYLHSCYQSKIKSRIWKSWSVVVCYIDILGLKEADSIRSIMSQIVLGSCGFVVPRQHYYPSI